MRARLVQTVLVAPIGVALAHAAAYHLAHPHISDRASALSGHDYLRFLWVAAALLTLVVVGRAIVAERRGAPLRPRVAPAVAVQVSAFLALEVGERVAVGQGLAAVTAVAGESAILLGIAVQPLVAMALIRALRWLPSMLSSAPEPRAARSWGHGPQRLGRPRVAACKPAPVRSPGTPRAPPRILSA